MNLHDTARPANGATASGTPRMRNRGTSKTILAALANGTLNKESFTADEAHAVAAREHPHLDIQTTWSLLSGLTSQKKLTRLARGTYAQYPMSPSRSKSKKAPEPKKLKKLVRAHFDAQINKPLSYEESLLLIVQIGPALLRIAKVLKRAEVMRQRLQAAGLSMET